MKRLPLLLVPALAVSLGASACERNQGEDRHALRVAAASDLRPAFEEIGRRFQGETGIPVEFTFASSGQLAVLIKQGAPYDLFASANTRAVDDVVAGGHGVASTRQTYAFGRLAVWSPAGARPADIPALAGREYSHIAVANPEVAPYGAAAVEALRRAGIFDGVQPRLVYGENVADALRLALSGNADAAIVAMSLARTAGKGSWTEVPADLHEPIEQALVVTTGPNESDAARFARYVTSGEGDEVLRRSGFVVPDQ